jgi:hypothetical protein
MTDLAELYTKFVESRNKYPQIRQAAEIALMGEIVERIKELELPRPLLNSDMRDAGREEILARMAKARAARKPREAPDAA